MKNHIKNAGQQGDVLLLRVESLPPDCKKIKGVTIALGEQTGHHHSFEEGSVTIMEAPAGQHFVVNDGDKPATLTHQEHKPITVAPGVWRFDQVQEKDWFEDMVRPVVD